MPLEAADNPWLLCVAAPKEAEAVWRGLAPEPPPKPFIPEAAWAPIDANDRFRLLLTHVGKANASAALAACIVSAPPCGIINLGVAGSLPASGLEIGDAVIATESVYADEGAETPDGFVDLAKMGFPPGPPDPQRNHEGLHLALARMIDPAPKRGVIATVSTCSGTDALAHTIRDRTKAIAEAMEGAALAYTARRLAPDIPFTEIRVISNTTGNRDAQQWDLPLALDRLTRIVRVL